MKKVWLVKGSLSAANMDASISITPSPETPQSPPAGSHAGLAAKLHSFDDESLEVAEEGGRVAVAKIKEGRAYVTRASEYGASDVHDTADTQIFGTARHGIIWHGTAVTSCTRSGGRPASRARAAASRSR